VTAAAGIASGRYHQGALRMSRFDPIDPHSHGLMLLTLYLTAAADIASGHYHQGALRFNRFSPIDPHSHVLMLPCFLNLLLQAFSGRYHQGVLRLNRCSPIDLQSCTAVCACCCKHCVRPLSPGRAACEPLYSHELMFFPALWNAAAGISSGRYHQGALRVSRFSHIDLHSWSSTVFDSAVFCLLLQALRRGITTRARCT
jgi:hypothetical protein